MRYLDFNMKFEVGIISLPKDNLISRLNSFRRLDISLKETELSTNFEQWLREEIEEVKLLLITPETLKQVIRGLMGDNNKKFGIDRFAELINTNEAFLILTDIPECAPATFSKETVVNSEVRLDFIEATSAEEDAKRIIQRLRYGGLDNIHSITLSNLIDLPYLD